MTAVLSAAELITPVARGGMTVAYRGRGGSTPCAVAGVAAGGSLLAFCFFCVVVRALGSRKRSLDFLEFSLAVKLLEQVSKLLAGSTLVKNAC